MKTYLDCIPCFIRQALEAARMATPDEAVCEQVLRRVLELATSMDMSRTPPEMAHKIHRIIREVCGVAGISFRPAAPSLRRRPHASVSENNLMSCDPSFTSGPTVTLVPIMLALDM